MIINTGASAGTDNTKIYENAPQNGGGVILPGYNVETGLTAAPTALTSGETTLIQLILGDSISSNSGAAAYTRINNQNEMLNIYTRNNWRYADPYLGPSNGPGSYPGRIGDKLITAGNKFIRTISIGCAMGGCTSYDYSKAGQFSHRYIAALFHARALGWPVSGAADSWRMAVIYAFGTNDHARGVSGADFTASAKSCFQNLRDYGFKGKIFVFKSTLLAGAVDAGLQAAQDGLIDVPNGILQGADMDSLTGGTNRQGDGTHLTTAGNDSLASLQKIKYDAAY